MLFLNTVTTKINVVVTVTIYRRFENAFAITISNFESIDITVKPKKQCEKLIVVNFCYNLFFEKGLLAT